MYVHKPKDTDKHEHFIKHLVYILTRAVRVKVSIPICTAHTGRYVSIRQVTGMRTARYRAVPPKSTISGRFWPSVVDFDRQRLIEGEKGKKKKKKKKRKRRKKRRRRIPRAVLAHTTPPPVGCPRAVLACTPSPPAGYPRGRKTRRRFTRACLRHSSHEPFEKTCPPKRRRKSIMTTEIDCRQSILAVPPGPHTGQLPDRYVSGGTGHIAR
ncbi:hypothetical protein GW17_00021785 [Ensete ventricosum]|nr:hypothetical protein GW17_00021785 [Ensete ventricosum]